MRLSALLRTLAAASLLIVASCTDPGRPTASTSLPNTPPLFDMVDCGSDDPKVCKRLQSSIWQLMNHPDEECRSVGMAANTRFHSASYGFRGHEMAPVNAEGYTMWVETVYGMPANKNTHYLFETFSDERWADPNWQRSIVGVIAHEEYHHLYQTHPPQGDFASSPLTRCVPSA